MNLKHIAAALAVAVTVTACESAGTKQTIGALGGGAAGGLIGAQFGSGTGQLAATAAGALLGAYLGGEIGRTMDDVDRLEAEQAYQKAATGPIGEEITWSNPDTGNSGSVTPLREGTSSSGAYCREFEQTVTIDERQENAYGVACRQPDGTWEIVH